MTRPDITCPTNPDKVCPHREAIVQEYMNHDGREDIPESNRLRDLTLGKAILGENTFLADNSCDGPTEAAICPTNERVRSNKVRQGLGQIIRTLVKR